MRTVRIILIVLVLIGFPAVSWIYLNSGLKWRITAQDETARKGHLGSFSLVEEDSTMLSAADIMGKYGVFVAPTDPGSVDHMHRISAQFNARKDLTLYYLFEGNQIPGVDSTWVRVQCTERCEQLLTALFEGGKTAAIVDDSLYVRGRYDLTSIEEMRKMVEHLAVVLPIEKREKIELKRGNN